MRFAKPLAALALASLSLAPRAQAATYRFGSGNERNESYFSRRLPTDAQREVSKLNRMEPLEVIPIPVLLGIEPGDFGDTWGDARSNGRTHEGTDILAPKDAYVVAPADSVVSDIGVGANGGNYAYTINPGGERFYFAHLDKYADGLKVGQILDKGDLIGYVGNTGNAAGGPTHLHFGVYAGGAQNPFPRLTESFGTQERLDAVKKIVREADDSDAEADLLAAKYPAFFRSAVAGGYDVPIEMIVALAKIPAGLPVAANVGNRDLTIGSQGADVVALQKALIKASVGIEADALEEAGATGYFGALTRAALAAWQAAHGISPAVGYYGPITRAKLPAIP